MKTEYKVIIFSIIFGLFAWVIVAVFEYFIFYEGTFWGLLISDISKHEVYTRSVMLGNFTIFGIVISGIIARRKRAEEALQKANRSLKTLSNCNQALVRATEELGLLNEMCRIIVQVGGYRLAWVGFVEQDENKTVLPVAQAGYEDGYLDTVNITWADTEQGRGPTGKAIRTGKPSILKNILTDPEYTPWRSEATRRGYGSSIAIPLIADDSTFGALNIYAAEPDAFGAEEEKRLTELADDMAYGIMALRIGVARKQAEEALKEAQRYTRGLIEASLDALATISPEGKITDVNHAVELITGMSRKEIIGTDFSNYFTEQEAARKSYQHVFRDGFVRDYPLEIKHSDGKITPVLYNASVYRDDQGRVAGVFAAARDVTELKRAEEEKIRLLAEVQAAEVANQAKSDFLASMSHELRTPLNAIMGFSQVLQEQYFGELNEKQAEYTNDILESGKHLLSLINDILDLSKVEAGRMELDLSQVNISSLLENSMIMIKEKAFKHGITLDLKIPEELSGLEIQADERKLKQVMFNLLSNAAKFTPDEGEIRVTVDLISELGVRILELKEAEKQLAIQNPKSKIEISVADNGIGLSPENQEKIFQEFYQVRGGTMDKTPGTGLGLPLTKKLVEMHGGRIWVESKGEGKGSRFSFLLPVKSESLELNADLLNHLRSLASSYEKHKKPFTLCYLHIDKEHFKEKASRIREAFEKEKRGDDFLARDKKGDIYLVMQGADRAKVKVACNRLIKKIKSMFEGLEISYSTATFPEDGETPDAILKKVRKG